MRLLLLFVIGSVVAGGASGRRAVAHPRSVIAASTIVALAYLSIRVVQ